MLKRLEINKDGALEIQRGSRVIQQYCPRQARSVCCGDYCALFGEPQYCQVAKVWSLELCEGKKLITENFDDERI